MDDLISRQASIDKINERQRRLIYCFGFENDMVKIMDIAKSIITAMPTVQPNEMLERCKFKYIYACKIVSFPTPDVTKKDKQDAYAVIKALQPIFGDVPFAKVKRGEENGTD